MQIEYPTGTGFGRGFPVIIFSNGDRLQVTWNIQVRALKDFHKNWRGRELVLKAGSLCYVQHEGHSLSIGKLGSGNVNFSPFKRGVEEGIDFELGNELPREHWGAPCVKRK